MNPERGTPVSLSAIDRDNYRDYLRLKVKPEQERFVASNATSMAQARFHREASLHGIDAGGIAVGFAMLEDWTQCPGEEPEDWRREPYVGLWRFMIDARYQRWGFGRRALELLIEHARTRPGIGVMRLSFVPGEEGSPGLFYAGLGFRETGEVDDGERVMRREL